MRKDKLIEIGLYHVGTGWFGVPGDRTGRFSSKVHFVHAGKPVCGSRLSPMAEYQWCAQYIDFRMVECRRCRSIVLGWQEWKDYVAKSRKMHGALLGY